MMLAMLPNTLEQNMAIQPQSLAYTLGNNGGEREGRRRDSIREMCKQLHREQRVEGGERRQKRRGETEVVMQERKEIVE